MIDEQNNNSYENNSGEPQQMPLGVGDEFTGHDGTLDPLAGAEAKTRINTGALLIAVVVMIAASGLFVMRTLAKMSNVANADTTTEEKINAFLDVLTGSGTTASRNRAGKSSADEGALEVLRESYTDRQVPLNNVQRNPFIIGEAPIAAATPDNPMPTQDGTERARTAMKERFARAGGRLTLTSTLLGSTPLANINGEIYRTGDVIYVEQEDIGLRIVKIESNTVHLKGEHAAFGLEVPIVLNIDF